METTRRNKLVETTVTVAGKPKTLLVFADQHDGRLTVHTAGSQPIVMDLTVAEATRQFDALGGAR